MKRGLLAAAWAALLLTSGGCASVRSYEREYLSDRIMTYEADRQEDQREEKWLEAREGSAGGTGGAGGGCACN